MKNKIIEAPRSLIVAIDSPDRMDIGSLAFALKNLSVGAYKVGSVPCLENGLKSVCRVIRDMGVKKMPIIYDHQKAATDIPDMGKPFAKLLSKSGVDAAILFPQAGPATAEAWIKECHDEGLFVIVGLAMTHEKFLLSEGGYITDDAPARLFELACSLGVRDFVVPGTKPEIVEALRGVLQREVGEGNYCFYSPGFISQGGDLTECGRVAGPNFHAIVGRGIYGKTTSDSQKEAAQQVIDCLAKIG